VTYKDKQESIPAGPLQGIRVIDLANIAGKLSATPGRVRHAAPPVGSSNRAILIDELGFTEDELGSQMKSRDGQSRAPSNHHLP
jgi:crotonobetainyl-CoA:carnitine CoA-transferase CaiB-like acyl-CoA transferase